MEEREERPLERVPGANLGWMETLVLPLII
jgi:hypothetical protein